MKHHLVIIALVIGCALCDSESDERTLTVTLNPGCENHNNIDCDKLTFVHIKAESNRDTLHHLWDYTSRIPSIFIARTDKNSTLEIDWDKFLDGSPDTLNFSSPPDFIFSAVVSKIYLFDDPEDKGDISHPSVKSVTSYDPRRTFIWNRENLTQFEDQHVMLTMAAKVKNTNASFAMKLSAFGSSDHSEELPHLYHTSHSMQIDLVVSNFTSNYTSPRVAIEFLIVSSENKTEGVFNLNKRRNLDDEFTPGIFDVYDIVSPRSNNDSRGAFIQYRPVSYITKWRTVSDSTELKPGIIKSFDSYKEEFEKFSFTLPFMYYGHDLWAQIAQGTNITLGVPNDGFYKRSNYTSFSVLMGMGSPPVEKLSMFVKTFAIVGLGIPLLVLVIGGTYVAIKRYRN